MDTQKEVHSLYDFLQGLKDTRSRFYNTTNSIAIRMVEAVDLFNEALGLTGTIAKDTDDERYALEAYMVSFRRIIASFILLESGLPQEAHMILRNAIEWILIGIDITYNKSSLEEWKKTDKVDFEDSGNWYFKARNVVDRIEKNENKVYPELERISAKEQYLKEWQYISNKSVHAHSKAQIAELFDSKGNFQLLGLKALEAYEKDFIMYQKMIFDLVTHIIGIPKYRDIISKSEIVAERRKTFVKKYEKIKLEFGSVDIEES